MEDLLTCTVCCEQYHERMRHPVLLPRCGHSFCRPCVAFLVKNGCVICPSCRMDQRVETADHLPTEFSLLAITSVQQVTKMETCQRHDVKLSFWCKTCSVAACGECLFEDHPTHSHNVLKATTYITEMKDSVTDIANKFMDALDLRERWYHEQIFQCAKTINDAIRTLTILRKDMDDARELMKGVKMVDGISPTTALSDASKCLGLKWNLKDCNLGLSRPSGKKEEKTAEEEKEKDESETKSKDEEDKNNDERKKEMNEKEKEIEESETLTEEEKRKRKKMLRVREKLAAAAAAAEKTTPDNEEKKEDKTSDKEKADDAKEKSSSSEPDQQPLTIGAAKTKLLAKKYAPVAREPSVTPDRDVSTSSKKASPAHQDKGEKDEDNKDTSTNKDTDSTNPKTTDDTEAKKEENTIANPEADTESKKDTENESNKSKESPSSSQTEASDKQKEVTSKVKKEPAVGATKRPRGRLARQALKRSQTMNFQQPPPDDNTANASDQNQSDNIRGLDLETTKTNKNEEPSVDNKELEAQADSETKGKKTEEEKAEEEKTDQSEQPGASNTNHNNNETVKPAFEMEPEEKERIATELMQVPSLTVIVEGVGGRLAHVTWEPKGLHVYCHQYQELPYDVIIKWNVLHAFLPTKSPMVFLDVGTEKALLGRVYINLWGHLRRANNFLHLCLGDRGPSYRNTMFLEVLNPDSPGERIKGGDYDYNNGRGGEGLLDDMERHEGYSMPMEAGLVTAGNPSRKEQDSQFYICTEDDYDRNFACPFGRVESGLYVMKEAVWLVVTQQVWIRDCGVVLDIPKF